MVTSLFQRRQNLLRCKTEDSGGCPQSLPVVYRCNMDAAWLLVVLAAAVLVSLVVLAVTCLHCRDRGPLSEHRSVFMLDVALMSLCPG